MNYFKTLLKFIISLLFIFIFIPNSYSKDESKTIFSKINVDRYFTNKKNVWKNHVFKKRKENKTIKGWHYDIIPKKKGDLEAIMYSTTIKLSPDFGTALFLMTPSYTNSIFPDSFEFTFHQSISLDDWSNGKVVDFCKNFVNQTKKNLKNKYVVLDRCWAHMHSDLKIWYEINLIIIPENRKK
jgi:hypothetical protein